MTSKENNLFQVWKVYQRRAESIAHYFDMRVTYYHYAWEEKSKKYKAASYLLKTIMTIKDLIKHRPRVIFIQLPPTPALYIVGAYGFLTKTPYITDCHNAMFMAQWIHWPLARTFLKRATTVLVHNDEMQIEAKKFGIKTIVIRDPLPQVTDIADTDLLQRFNLKSGAYIIVPWNFASDEPIAEFIDAVKLVPKIKFVMTWFTERLPESLREHLPGNIIFTGYLKIGEFNELFAKSGAAITLTTRPGTQPSAASEAIAFGVPLVISDTDIARLLYREMPIYVENTPQSIAQGVSELFVKHKYYKEKAIDFHNLYRDELEKEITHLKAQIP